METVLCCDYREVLAGPYLLQHVLGKVLLLVHGEDGPLDLLVGQLQPAGRVGWGGWGGSKQREPPLESFRYHPYILNILDDFSVWLQGER